jgi:hypothetical protein
MLASFSTVATLTLIALGEQRVALDRRAEPVELDRVAIVDEEHRVRIADVDRRGLLELLPATGSAPVSIA